MSKLKSSNIITYAEIALTVIFAGIGFAYLGKSLIEPWKVIVPCVVLRFMCAALLMREKIAGNVLRLVLLGVFASSAWFLLSLALNYHIPRKGELHDEIATVEQRYTKTRHRTKRVGRRVTAQGEPYKVYYIVLRLSDGKTKDMEVTHSTYRHFSKGDTLTVTLDRGILNIPVIKSQII